MAKTAKASGSTATTELPAPTPWPGANARMLGLGVGLPVAPLARLAQFSAADFERFTLEWATDYLAKQTQVFEVQSRGGSGDKGRDIIVWLDAANKAPRRWQLYQCKHYDAKLGLSKAGIEIAKVLYYTHIGDYTPPESYYFVTHKGVTSPFQDLLDSPESLKKEMVDTWDTYSKSITSTKTITLSPELETHISNFDFSIFAAKQPHDLLAEHAQTKYHLMVFGAPLVNRPPPPPPPSTVAAIEAKYIEKLYRVIGHDIGITVGDAADFEDSQYHSRMFARSRLTFYSAEGLKEVARDQMADQQFFDTLLDEFCDGLYYQYTEPSGSPIDRLKATVRAAQNIQLGSHPLEPHVTSKDREGMCHQMANEDRLDWCNP
ncbi:ABC-three component system protein [Burkholderia sp. Ac-20365]|uniref:ABC-three component system protein n=1 Tax=Burkholderia sp. Ac-20365 TaxID=2703897 RepID=UPI00197BF6F9|nr:ABC-three component system protein [Burkholderia sp. Ac-20365]MBN3761975.1 restriction endonuclease [Burkholderia sp. Ac-20365]